MRSAWPSTPAVIPSRSSRWVVGRQFAEGRGVAQPREIAGSDEVEGARVAARPAQQPRY